MMGGRRLVPARLVPIILLGLIAAAEFASPRPTAGRAAGLALAMALGVWFLQDSLRHLRLAARVRSVLRTRFLEIALTMAALTLLAAKGFVWARELADPTRRPALDPIYRQYLLGFLLVAALRTAAGGFPARRFLHRLQLQPAQTVALGFAATILAGTLLLALPLSLTRLEALSLLDVLFTAASAVTTTGLVVYDAGSYHTPFGQVVLLGLIQLGGFGTMAASASLVVLAGRRLPLVSAAALQQTLDLQAVGQVRSELKTVMVLTIVVEAAATLLLYLLWQDRPGIDHPAFAALFHAVSAFCTAGFSTFRDGLRQFADDSATSAVVGLAALLGALGGPVLGSLGRLLRGPRPRPRVPRLTLHARLALVTTAILLVGATLLILGLEWRRTLAPLAWPTRLVGAAFLAVTAQSTVGFNTVDTGALAPATLWLLMLLMFVGGSPGSTAGGIKTTTLAAVVATLWATIQGRDRVVAFHRTIPEEQISKALALVGISGAVVAAAVVILLVTQPADPLALTFETVSAFGTVGLSTGLTSTLDGWGKLVVILVMFVGRTGPLTLGFALAARARRHHVAYPAEKIMLG